MSWKIRLTVKTNSNRCPHKCNDRCLSNKRIHANNPTVNVKCKENKCSYKKEDDYGLN